MKEATGEANMTVITIVIIALVLAIGTPIVTNILNGSSNKSKCSGAGGVWFNNNCYVASSCTSNAKGITGCTSKLTNYDK